MIDNEFITEIARELKKVKRVVAFTGAGVSEESGIPTYRSKGGIWIKYDPSKYASLEGFNENPSYYWEFFKESRKSVLEKARPNPAHYALAELEKIGKLKCVITQNIDGLHQSAGTKDVIELHGTTKTFRCRKCEKRYTLNDVNELLETQLPPKCSKCNDIIRPNVIFFGEILPEDAINRAIREAEQSDFLIAVGSSLVVYPAAQIPMTAKEHGAKLLIVNLEETGMDFMADFMLKGKAGKIVPELVEKLALV